MRFVSRSAIQDLTILSNVRIASPCHVPWNSMQGDERVRHCDQCKLNVYNISAMSKEDAEQLILQREGRLCISLFRRTDGRILTRDCPKGVMRLAKRMIGLGVWLAAACISLFVTAAALAVGPRGSGQLRLRVITPFNKVSIRCAEIEDWLGLPKKWRSNPSPRGGQESGFAVFPDPPAWSDLSPYQQLEVQRLLHAEEMVNPHVVECDPAKRLHSALTDWVFARTEVTVE